MARPGVTREDVFAAADALALKGETPTVVGVRTQLGGGSPNTITPLLAEWKASHETKRADTLPPLPEPVEGAMRQVWGAAWKGAQEQLEAEREALSTARKDIEKERSDMLAEINRLDGALEQAQGEQRKTAEALDGERRGHEQTRSEVREARAIATEREKRIDDQGRELADVRRQASDASTRASALDAEVSHLRRDLESARAETRREVEARAEDRRKHDLVAAELKEALAANERLSGSLDREKETTKQAKAALDTGGKKIAALEMALEDERRRRMDAEQLAADLRVQVATLAERAAHVDELRQLLHQVQPPTKKTAAKKSQPKLAEPGQED